MSSVIGSLTGGNAAKQAQQQAAYNNFMNTVNQVQQQTAAHNINSTFERTFDPAFYQKQQQNYLDYQTPQLNKQYSDAQKALTFALDRSGNLNSSARSQQEASLSADYDKNVQTLNSNALEASNAIRGNVENARASLLNSLQNSGNVSGAVNGAASQAASLSQTPTYSPLANMFESTTSALAQQAAQSKAQNLANGNLFGGGGYNFSGAPRSVVNAG